MEIYYFNGARFSNILNGNHMSMHGFLTSYKAKFEWDRANGNVVRRVLENHAATR
jgi:hypothetical protein